MPTGYTYDVQSGKIADLHGYALACARAMSPLIHMRDMPNDAAVPYKIPVCTDYHDNNITQAEKLLIELPLLNEQECNSRAAAELAELAESIRHQEGLVNQKRLHRARYEAMLSQVTAWECPKEVSSLKAFMVQQLVDSIKWDCAEYHYSETTFVQLTAKEWRERAIASAQNDLIYNTRKRNEQIESNVKAQRWLDALRASLPPACIPER